MAKFNFYAGASASAILLAVLVILSELVEPFKALLASIFGYHWIGKAALVILVFLLAGFLLKEKTSFGKISFKDLAWKASLASLAVIFLFYVIEFFF